MPLDAAIATAVRAVRHATYRDGFSGGYINVLVVNATGIHHIRRVDSKTISMESYFPLTFHL
jgi:20S proteasome alpha/beta subunit